MGWAVAIVGRKARARRQKWRAEVGPRMRGVRPRPLWFRRRSVFWAGIGGEWEHSNSRLAFMHRVKERQQGA